jgi:hypothetical protein
LINRSSLSKENFDVGATPMTMFNSVVLTTWLTRYAFRKKIRASPTGAVSRASALFLGRAHSVGRLRQHVDLIGYALLVNGLTVLRHERRGRIPTAA